MRNENSNLRCLALGLAMILASANAHAGSIPISSGNGLFNLKIESIKERRFKEVVRQQYDFSCGSAAVATLLTYHYRQPISEQAVFSAMLENGDQERIRREGFSLLDMKNFLISQGYRSNGYRVAIDKLAEARIPGIVLINSDGYQHFVVVKGVTEQEILIADPAVGNKILRREDFEAMWDGAVFIVLDDMQVAAQHFDEADAWTIRDKAPIQSSVMRTGLGSLALHLPGRNFF